MDFSSGWIDFIVLAVSLVAVVAIGIGFRGRVHNVDDYLLGDRNIPWWAILGSIVATETSTATVVSVPGIGFGPVGMRFLQIAFGYVVGRAIVVRVLLPLYFQGRLFTAYQVLEKSFGVRTRRVASALFLVTRNVGDGLRLFLAALVLQQLVGWPLAGSLVVMGGITIFYTYGGGMRSVVWNDCLQFVIYMVGAIAMVFVIADRIPGGFAEWWEYARAHDKLRIVNPQLTWSDPYNIWAGLLGGAALTIATHGTDHMMVQRYLSARSQRDAGRAIVLSGFVVLFQIALFLMIGVGLSCFYAQRPDVTFERTDQVFATFLVDEFPVNTGLIGLVLAAILAAAMSTLSSSLNSSAAALVNDFYLPWRASPLAPDRELAITRYVCILFGVVQIAVGFGAALLTEAVVTSALTIAGFSFGLLLGIYLLGILTRRVGEPAAIAGIAVGALVLILLQFGGALLHYLWPQDYPVPLPPLAWPWLALVGATTTFVSGLLFSIPFPRPNTEQR